MKNDFWGGAKFAANVLREDDFLTFIVLAWREWFFRNIKVHDGSYPLLENSHAWAVDFSHEVSVVAVAWTAPCQLIFQQILVASLLQQPRLVGYHLS